MQERKEEKRKDKKKKEFRGRRGMPLTNKTRLKRQKNEELTEKKRV